MFDNKKRIKSEEIVFLETHKGLPHKLEIHTLSENFIISGTLKDFDDGHHKFLRTSISTIVNTTYIEYVVKKHSAFIIKFRENRLAGCCGTKKARKFKNFFAFSYLIQAEN